MAAYMFGDEGAHEDLFIGPTLGAPAPAFTGTPTVSGAPAPAPVQAAKPAPASKESLQPMLAGYTGDRYHYEETCGWNEADYYGQSPNEYVCGQELVRTPNLPNEGNGIALFQTRHGQLGYAPSRGHFMPDQRVDGERDIKDIYMADTKAFDLTTELNAKFALLDGADKLMRPAGEVTGQVDANTTKDVSNAAQDMALADLSVKSMALHTEEATQKLQESSDDLQIASRNSANSKRRAEAKALASKAKKIQKGVDAGIKVGGALLSAAVGVATAKPTALIKPAWDFMAAIIGVSTDPGGMALADQLMKFTDDHDAQTVAIAYKSAVKRLQGAEKLARMVYQAAQETDVEFRRQRTRAEGEFDSTTKGDFKFGPLAAKADLAEQCQNLGTQAVEAVAAAIKQCNLHAPGNWDDQWDNKYQKEVVQTIRAMRNEHLANLGVANQKLVASSILYAQLGGLRATGDREMTTAPTVPAKK